MNDIPHDLALGCPCCDDCEELKKHVQELEQKSEKLQKDKDLHWEFAKWLTESLDFTCTVNEAWQEFRKSSQDPS